MMLYVRNMCNVCGASFVTLLVNGYRQDQKGWDDFTDLHKQFHKRTPN